MTPKLCAINLDMSLKVISDEFVSTIKCTICISFLDARVVEGFGPGGDGPVLLSEVECSGTEDRLTMCSSVGIGDHSCGRENSAGVACGEGI